MARVRHTTESFIEVAKQVHGDTFDYSNAEFKGIRVPVEITCKRHGSFMQDPYSHLKGAGCGRCKKITTVEDALAKFSEVHGDKYDYSKFTKWPGGTSKIQIGCPIHGEFSQTIAEHLKGSGCNECGKLKKAATLKKGVEEYIADARRVHGDKYDYSLWVPETTAWHNKVTIVCPEHGPFEQLLGSHIKGRGCERCGLAAASLKSRVTKDERIKQSVDLYGDVYDYSKVGDGVPNMDPITIRCKVHDVESNTTWNQHLSAGVQCPQCVADRKRKYELETYGVEHHKQRHLGPDVLSKLNDVDWLTEQNHVHQLSITGIAEKLGCWYAVINDRFQKFNIPIKTVTGSSQGERDLRDELAKHVEVVSNTREIIAPLELDIYIPSHNLAIEYCGLYWHSDKFRDRNYHLNKLDACEAKGIRLITIFEDEWLADSNRVIRKILNILGLDQSIKVHARSCTVVELTAQQKREFFDQHHIQGSGPGSVTYGLVHEGVIVAAMTFIKQPGGRWDLNRFATSTRIPGGFSKLLTHFKRSHQWSEIVSFADRRWSEGDLYNKSGFTLEKVLPPDYYYTDTKIRKHKFNFRHKNLPKILGEQYNPNETEFQNMDCTQFLRIWNCGLLRYVTRSTS